MPWKVALPPIAVSRGPKALKKGDEQGQGDVTQIHCAGGKIILPVPIPSASVAPTEIKQVDYS